MNTPRGQCKGGDFLRGLQNCSKWEDQASMADETTPCCAWSMGIRTYSTTQSLLTSVTSPFRSVPSLHFTCIIVCCGILMKGISVMSVSSRYPKTHLRMAWCATMRRGDVEPPRHSSSNRSKKGTNRSQQSTYDSPMGYRYLSLSSSLP